MPELIHTQQNLSVLDFDEFEKKFHRPLPLSFKSHYLAHNGGCPAEQDVENGEWGLPVHGFNPIKHGKVTIEMLIDDYGSINPADSSFGDWPRLTFVPFAYDAGANPIFLSLRDQDFDAIYIYDPDGQGIAKISSSFAQFRARLYKTETDVATEK